jgi:hypothetical protein
MSTNLKRLFTFKRSRLIVCRLFVISAIVAVLGAIVFSSAIAQRSGGSASPEGDRVVVPSGTGATPTPLPCPGCWNPTTQSENFDGLTPPALPPGWLATNAQGPPPLWVTSDSGLPMPPADTSPNALFIDDPPVVSDKRLDGWFLDFFEDCCVRLNIPAQFQSRSLRIRS